MATVGKMKVVYIVDGEQVPYMIWVDVQPQDMTLTCFKSCTRRFNYRFFFLSFDEEFGSLKVEITEETSICPSSEGLVKAWLQPLDLSDDTTKMSPLTLTSQNMTGTTDANTTDLSSSRVISGCSASPGSGQQNQSNSEGNHSNSEADPGGFMTSSPTPWITSRGNQRYHSAEFYRDYQQTENLREVLSDSCVEALSRTEWDLWPMIQQRRHLLQQQSQAGLNPDDVWSIIDKKRKDLRVKQLADSFAQANISSVVSEEKISPIAKTESRIDSNEDHYGHKKTVQQRSDANEDHYGHRKTVRQRIDANEDNHGHRKTAILFSSGKTAGGSDEQQAENQKDSERGQKQKDEKGNRMRSNLPEMMETYAVPFDTILMPDELYPAIPGSGAVGPPALVGSCQDDSMSSGKSSNVFYPATIPETPENSSLPPSGASRGGPVQQKKMQFVAPTSASELSTDTDLITDKRFHRTNLKHGNPHQRRHTYGKLPGSKKLSNLPARTSTWNHHKIDVNLPARTSTWNHHKIVNQPPFCKVRQDKTPCQILSTPDQSDIYVPPSLACSFCEKIVPVSSKGEGSADQLSTTDLFSVSTFQRSKTAAPHKRETPHLRACNPNFTVKPSSSLRSPKVLKETERPKTRSSPRPLPVLENMTCSHGNTQTNAVETQEEKYTENDGDKHCRGRRPIQSQTKSNKQITKKLSDQISDTGVNTKVDVHVPVTLRDVHRPVTLRSDSDTVCIEIQNILSEYSPLTPEVKDRRWLKCDVPNALIGKDLVKWLKKNRQRLPPDTSPLEFAQTMLDRGFLTHLLSKHGKFNTRRYYSVAGNYN